METDNGVSGGYRAGSKPWGITGDGRPVDLCYLEGPAGVRVEAITYGAAIRSVEVPDRSGELSSVVLGLGTVAEYEFNTAYLGAVIGRYGNRIGGARLKVGDEEYRLPVNQAPNSLHSGPDGFDRRVWSVRSIESDADQASVEFGLISPDGDGGFPGELSASVRYGLRSIDGTVALAIDYRAQTDRLTVCNLTNHSYFDLSAGRAPDVLDHQVQILGRAIAEVDETLIPTGSLMPVEDTPFDFRLPMAIGDRIDSSHQQMRYGVGYDHSYQLDGNGLRTVARVLDPLSGRRLDVDTTEPALQFYSGNHLQGAAGVDRDGSGGGEQPQRVFAHRGGFCMETQHHPDSPNRPEFPSTLLHPGAEYRSSTVFRFSVADASAL